MNDRACMYCKRYDREHYFVIRRFDIDDSNFYDAFLCHYCYVGNSSWDNVIVHDERNCYAGMREGMPIIERLKAYCKRNLIKGTNKTIATFHALRLMLMYGNGIAELILLDVGKPSIYMIIASMNGKTRQALVPSSI